MRTLTGAGVVLPVSCFAEWPIVFADRPLLLARFRVYFIREGLTTGKALTRLLWASLSDIRVSRNGDCFRTGDERRATGLLASQVASREEEQYGCQAIKAPCRFGAH
jgi:hypothetical protein